MKKSVNRARSTQLAVDRFHVVAQRFRHVQIECRPAWDVIDTYTNGLGPDTLIYCDPPYVHGSRSGGYGYAHEMTDDNHRCLAQSLQTTTATVLLSGYPSDLYDNEPYPTWSRHEIATTATVGHSEHRPRTEVIWSNRPLNAQQALPLVTGAHQ